MSWSVKYDPAQNIIVEVYRGITTAEDLRGAIAERIAIEEKTGAKNILVDILDIELAANTIEIFSLPNNFYNEVKASLNSRISLVVPADHRVKEAARFFETACVNRGWNVKIFAERKSAIEWLVKKAGA